MPDTRLIRKKRYGICFLYQLSWILKNIRFSSLNTFSLGEYFRFTAVAIRSVLHNWLEKSFQNISKKIEFLYHQVKEEKLEPDSFEQALNDIYRVQGVLAVFVFIYITQMVFRSAVTLEKVVYYIDQLNNDDKLKLIEVISHSIQNNSQI